MNELMITAATALIGAIGFLFRTLMTRIAETEKRNAEVQKVVREELAECRQRDEVSQSKLLEFAAELGEMKGRQDGVVQISQLVLDRLDGLKK